MKIDEIFTHSPIVPVLTVTDLDHVVPLVTALADGGMKVIEIALRSSQAFDAIKLVRKQCKDILLGAGTIITEEQFESVVEAGAQFAVSPISPEYLMKKVLQLGTPFLPGVATPSEIATAINHGFNTLKMFPLDLMGGQRFVSGIMQPMFSNIKFCCSCSTSSPENVEYLQYPNIISIASGWSAPAHLVAAKNWAGISEMARNDLEKVASIGKPVTTK